MSIISTQLSVFADQALSGREAIFPQSLYEKYIREVRKTHPEIKTNYQGIGSKQKIASDINFGAIDIAMTDSKIANKGSVLLIPATSGSVSVAYNLIGFKNLKLSNEALIGIFNGSITFWNDPQIADDNKGVTLPHQIIKIAVRNGSSDTSLTFTNYLSAISPEFKNQIGTSTLPRWPYQFLKFTSKQSLADYIQYNSGAIGYIEYDLAVQNNMSLTLATATTPNSNPVLVEGVASKENAEQYKRSGDTKLGGSFYKYAITDYTQAIKLNPKFSNAYINRGYAYFKLGKYGDAIEDASRAIEIAPKDSDAYNLRGAAYFASNISGIDTDRAMADFEQAIKLNSNNFNARQNLREVKQYLIVSEVYNRDRSGYARSVIYR